MSIQLHNSIAHLWLPWMRDTMNIPHFNACSSSNRPWDSTLADQCTYTWPWCLESVGRLLHKSIGGLAAAGKKIFRRGMLLHFIAFTCVCITVSRHPSLRGDLGIKDYYNRSHTALLLHRCSSFAYSSIYIDFYVNILINLLKRRLQVTVKWKIVK